MTRESKLALIIGFVLVLVVGVLVSDHFSQANAMDLDTQEPDSRKALGPIAELGGTQRAGLGDAIGNALGERSGAPTMQVPPVEIDNSRRSIAGTTGSNANLVDNSSIIDRAYNEGRRIIQDTELPKAAQISNRALPPNLGSSTPELSEIQFKTHKVVAGDTLIRIARSKLGDGERWTQIHELNADKLGPDAILKIGMYLKLPSDAKSTTQSRETNSGSSSSSSGTTYTVIAGDILGNISMKLLGTSKRADEIAKLNGLESPNDIRVGMKLKIPAK